jgi:hypothetical protein
MLVQPALIAHLLCRPVSIADTRSLREKLQVLRGLCVVCYGFGPQQLGGAFRIGAVSKLVSKLLI